MRLELSARARGLLRRLPRTNAYTIAELVLLALLAWQCARFVWAVATPVTPLGDWRPAEPGLGGSPTDVLRGFDPFFRLSGANDKPQAITPLPLTLFGVRINEATGSGSAIIQTADNVQNDFAVGDEIMPGATLKAVAFDHVEIDRGGMIENLYIDQSKPVTMVTPTPAAAPPPPALPSNQQSINSRGISLSQLRSGIGFIPRIDKGKVSGLVVRPNGDGSVFAKAGLQQGDIVSEVMGEPVTGPSDLQRAGASLQSGGILSLTVERGAHSIPIGINVTGP